MLTIEASWREIPGACPGRLYHGSSLCPPSKTQVAQQTAAACGTRPTDVRWLRASWPSSRVSAGPGRPRDYASHLGFLVRQQPQDGNTACHLPVPLESSGVKGTHILKGFLSTMDPVACGVETGGTRLIYAVRSQHSGDPWREVSDLKRFLGSGNVLPFAQGIDCVGRWNPYGTCSLPCACVLSCTTKSWPLGI